MTTLVAVIPSVGVLFLFWLALRAILQADRRERVAQARLDAAEDAAIAGGATGAATDDAAAEPGSSALS